MNFYREYFLGVYQELVSDSSLFLYKMGAEVLALMVIGYFYDKFNVIFVNVWLFFVIFCHSAFYYFFGFFENYPVYLACFFLFSVSTVGIYMMIGFSVAYGFAWNITADMCGDYKEAFSLASFGYLFAKILSIYLTQYYIKQLHEFAEALLIGGLPLLAIVLVLLIKEGKLSKKTKKLLPIANN